MAYAKPNYTQAPNVFFDEHILVMSESEFKIVAVVIRYTFGYHRERHAMSLGFFEKATGLTRQSVIDGLKAAMRRGVIDRTEVGNSYEYWLVVNEIDQSQNDQSKIQTTPSQANRLPLVNEVDRSKHPLKKVVKENPKDNSLTPEMQKAYSIWETVYAQLAHSLPKEVFSMHLAGAVMNDYRDGCYTLAVSYPSSLAWLTRQLKPNVVKVFETVSGQPTDVKFVLKAQD